MWVEKLNAKSRHYYTDGYRVSTPHNQLYPINSLPMGNLAIVQAVIHHAPEEYSDPWDYAYNYS